LSYRRVFLRFLIAFVFSVVLAGIGLIAIAFAPPLDGVRRELATSFVERAINRKVQFDGPLDITISNGLEISVADASILNPSWTKRPQLLHVRSLKLGIDVGAVLLGRLALSHIVIDKALLNLEIAPDGHKNWAEAADADSQGIDPLAIALPAVPIAEHVKITDLEIVRIDRHKGFDAKVDIESFELAPDQKQDRRAIKGSGTLNSEPFSVEGSLPIFKDGRLSQDGAIAASFKSKGIFASLSGQLDPVTRKLNPRIDLRLNSSSIGDLLEVIDLDRALEGTGDVSAELWVADRQVALRDVNANIETRAGKTITVSGSIEDMLTVARPRLSFAADLEPEIQQSDHSAGREQTRFDFVTALTNKDQSNDNSGLFDDLKLTEVSGEVTGNWGALRIEKLLMQTNALSRDIRRIGPISIDAFRTDPEGRLQLIGINATAGPAAAPTFKLTGDIKDLLRLERLSLSGSFALNLAEVIGLHSLEAKQKLGTLSGEFALSDHDASLGLDALTAEVVGTKLITAKLSSVIDDLREGDGLEIGLSLGVPDYANLATVLGKTPHKIGKFKFEGQVSGDQEKVRVKGAASLGETDVSGELTGSVRDNKPSFQGELNSKSLKWSDLRAVALLARTGHDPPPDTATSRPGTSRGSTDKAFSDFVASLSSFNLELKAKADKILNGGTKLSGLSTNIKLHDGVLKIDPFQISYLGGRVNLKSELTARASPPRLKISGRLDDWRLGSVLNSLGVKTPISGELHSTFNLSGKGRTVDALVASSNGRLDIAISRGRIESSLVSLTGLDLTSYLFSDAAQRGYTRLNCMISRFGVKNGIASVQQLILDTPDIQMIGQGWINLKNKTLSIRVKPHPRRRRIVELATPFTIQGSLLKPKMITHKVALRGVGEVLLWEVNLLGSLIDLIADGGQDANNPCLGKGARKP
jgi:AsmA family protein